MEKQCLVSSVMMDSEGQAKDLWVFSWVWSIQGGQWFWSKLWRCWWIISTKHSWVDDCICSFIMISREWITDAHPRVQITSVTWSGGCFASTSTGFIWVAYNNNSNAASTSVKEFSSWPRPSSCHNIWCGTIWEGNTAARCKTKLERWNCSEVHTVIASLRL